MKTVARLLLSIVLSVVAVESTLGCWYARKTLNKDAEYRVAVGLEFRSRDVVFSGEVTDRSRTQVTLRVARVWKGAIPPIVQLSSEYLEKKGSETFWTDCAYSHFEIGKNYLVYADSFENQIQVFECSRTQLLHDADKDMNMLNELKTPENPKPPLKESGLSSFFL